MSTNYTININIHNLNNVTVGDIKITPPDVTDTVVECDGMDLQASPEEIFHLECLLSREADTPIALDADEPVSLDDDEPVALDADEPVSLDDAPTSLDDECSGPSCPDEIPYPLDLFYDEVDEAEAAAEDDGYDYDDDEHVSLDEDEPTSLDNENDGERNCLSRPCCGGVCPSSAGTLDEDADLSPSPSDLHVSLDDDADAISLDDNEATSLD